MDMSFHFGIEHEVAFLRSDGDFADYTNTTYQELADIIEELPVYEGDYDQLRIGDAGIRYKRWYVEGVERFDQAGSLVGCIPKGIEIRTTIHDKIDDTIGELTQSFDMLKAVCSQKELIPVLTSYNPIRKPFEFDPPLNAYEKRQYRGQVEKKTTIPMMTYGPDLNLSADHIQGEALVDIARKLTYYSPFIVPFSFSAPFADRGNWDGLSKRTFVRTGLRPAVMVYVKAAPPAPIKIPKLIKEAGMNSEVGRIEFKAFDSCGDFMQYASLLALLKGLIRDTKLGGRADYPSASWHRIAALEGFGNAQVFENAKRVMSAVKNSLLGDPDAKYLECLNRMLETRETPATVMRERCIAGESTTSVLLDQYQWDALAHFAQLDNECGPSEGNF